MITIVNVAIGFGAILLMLGTLAGAVVQGAEAEIRAGRPPASSQPTLREPAVAADRERAQWRSRMERTVRRNEPGGYAAARTARLGGA